jgi:hypothetical protein
MENPVAQTDWLELAGLNRGERRRAFGAPQREGNKVGIPPFGRASLFGDNAPAMSG